jgi:hypothetical protein
MGEPMKPLKEALALQSGEGVRTTVVSFLQETMISF